jgi:hypothetical protein
MEHNPSAPPRAAVGVRDTPALLRAAARMPTGPLGI